MWDTHTHITFFSVARYKQGFFLYLKKVHLTQGYNIPAGLDTGHDGVYDQKKNTC